MITMYRPQTARWAVASVLMLFVSTWGGCRFFTYLKRPRFSALSGTAAEHVDRGRRILDAPCDPFWEDCYDPHPEQVGVAALEFEAALLIDPRDEAAILGKAECLEKIGDRTEDSVYYRQAVNHAERVVRMSENPARVRKGLWNAARLRTKPREDRPALEDYRRLIVTEPDASARLQARYQAALSGEKLDLMAPALDDLRRLERWTGDGIRFADDIHRIATKVGKIRDVPATNK